MTRKSEKMTDETIDDFNIDNLLCIATEHFLPPVYYIPRGKTRIINGIECNINERCTPQEYWDYSDKWNKECK